MARSQGAGEAIFFGVHSAMICSGYHGGQGHFICIVLDFLGTWAVSASAVSASVVSASAVSTSASASTLHRRLYI
jgi:hypothetical protein